MKQHAKEVGIPISRIIDKALYMYLSEYAPFSETLENEWIQGEIKRYHDDKLEAVRVLVV